jgi:hypothetical protein
MYKDDYNFPSSMESANFWLSTIKTPHENILSLKEIKAFNKALMNKLPSLFSFDEEENTISSEKLIQYINSYEFPSKDMYDSNGCLITKEFYIKVILNTNLKNVNRYVSIKYGISLRKISIRSFPTEEAVYSTIKDSQLDNFDRFQETGCLAFDPLLILHESLDKQWLFVKTYNYMGWTKACDVCICEDKEQFLNYSNCENFIIITGKEVALTLEDENPELNLKLGMGTKLCIVDNCSLNSSEASENIPIKIPAKDIDGKLIFKVAYLNKRDDISKGYLSYTPYNILNQALKFLYTTYDWGDKYSGKDCSSFILTIFRCFGFYLPRNANEQENSFVNKNSSVIFSEYDTIEERYNKMNSLLPGAALFMKGHVMLYLGKHEGIHYMIHSFLGYAVKKGATYEAKTALCVGISPVNIFTASGTPFVSKFTSAVNFGFPINENKKSSDI